VVSEWLWGGGRLRVAVTLGLPFGLVIGIMQWVTSGATAGIRGMLLGGVMYGVFMTVIFVAVVETVSGSAAETAIVWAAAAFFLGFVGSMPRRFVRRRRQAAGAARLAMSAEQ
jgi:hypothetical protein